MMSDEVYLTYSAAACTMSSVFWSRFRANYENGQDNSLFSIDESDGERPTTDL